jgi:dTMP kinase
MARGRFIAFCGGEGAGKSTQIALLARHLEKRRAKLIVTREPGGTPAGQHLRKLLLTSTGAPWTPMAETLLMIADRAQHVENLILPALAGGTHVISDRFVLSTLSYQGAGRGISTALIKELHRQACADLWPDLTVVFDIDPAIGLARSKRRLSESGSDEGRFEDLDLAFHQRVRAGFLAEAEASGRDHVVIDATRPVAEIAAEIAGLVDGVMGAGSSG